MLGEYYAVIGLSNGLIGNCGISLSKQLAYQVSSAMFGLEVDEEELLFDSLGEIVNLIAGGASRQLAGMNAYRFGITPPTVLANHGPEAMYVYNPAGTECIVIECGVNEFADSMMIELSFVPEKK